MVLVSSGCDRRGRMAADDLCSRRSGRDAHADQDPCRAGRRNEHAYSNIHAPAQSDVHLISVTISDECTSQR